MRQFGIFFFKKSEKYPSIRIQSIFPNLMIFVFGHFLKVK